MKKARSGLFSTTVWPIAALGWGLACGDGAPIEAGPCGRYAGTSTEGFCRARAAGEAARPETLDAYCAASGEWAPLCRQRFVRAQLAQGAAPRDVLIEWCGGDADCALEVLDLRPASGWSEQRALCLERAGPYAQDCLTHALGRWATGAPTAGEFDALIADPGPDAALVGGWLGAVVACRGLRACPAEGPTAAACAEGEATLRAEPHRCPQPIHGPAGPPPIPPSPAGSPAAAPAR